MNLLPWICSKFSFWGESVNRNSFIMICKGYIMWSILVLLAIFISVETLSILDPCQRTYRSAWTQENLDSPFSKDAQAHYHDEFWQGITEAAPAKSLCFIFTIPVHFIHSAINVFKYYFFFISPIFIFHIIL